MTRKRAGQKRKPVAKAQVKRGPKPQTLKIEGDWQAAVKTATTKNRPAGGWPKP